MKQPMFWFQSYRKWKIFNEHFGLFFIDNYHMASEDLKYSVEVI